MLNFLSAIENLVLTYLLETNLDLLDQILTLLLVSFTTFYILGKASIKKTLLVADMSANFWAHPPVVIEKPVSADTFANFFGCI